MSLCEHCHEFPKAAKSPKYCSTQCKKRASKRRSKASKTLPTDGSANKLSNDEGKGGKVAIDPETKYQKGLEDIETSQIAEPSSSKRSSKSPIPLKTPGDVEDFKKLAHKDAVGEGAKDDSEEWETEEEEGSHDFKFNTRRMFRYRKGEKAFLDAVLPSMKAEMMAETFGWKAASAMDPATFGYNFYSD